MSEILREAALLRIYALSGDRAGEGSEAPLTEAVVAAARQAGLAGATVLKGSMGFGATGRFYSTLLDEVMPERCPLVIEIADAPEALQAFLPSLYALLKEPRLITLERAEVVLYRAGEV